MKILLLGSGGREHAFAWKIIKSEKCSKLFVAPGNAGTAGLAENVDLSITDFEAIAQFVMTNNIEMVVVGPEEPLVKGIVDFFQNHDHISGITIIGPGSEGALLEGSKDFSKRFMQRNNIPTAAYETFTKETLADGLAFIQKQTPPIVLKADGLAGGKGVLICQSREEASESLTEMLVGQKFGDASSKVVIEEFLDGIELSVFVATDGNSYRILPEAKDYKRIGEGDTGLNTGGMGAVSPVPFADEAFMQKVEERIVRPSILGLKKEKIPYNGFLFIGLMNIGGNPFVIEYNVRMGDPETQAVLPRIKSDFVDLLEAIGTGRLQDYKLEIENFSATTIVMVAGGYPEAYEKGFEISGLEGSMEDSKTVVFHAGTKRNVSGNPITNGGRVIAVTGFGVNTEEALQNAYKKTTEITWRNAYYRKDIGQDILKLVN